ncbi:MAG: hypothetical protein ACRDP7_24905, partial [Trebonia sp.]
MYTTIGPSEVPSRAVVRNTPNTSCRTRPGWMTASAAGTQTSAACQERRHGGQRRQQQQEFPQRRDTTHLRRS